MKSLLPAHGFCATTQIGDLVPEWLQVKVSLLGIFGKLVGAYLNNGLAKYLKKSSLWFKKEEGPHGREGKWINKHCDKQTSITMRILMTDFVFFIYPSVMIQNWGKNCKHSVIFPWMYCTPFSILYNIAYLIRNCFGVNLSKQGDLWQNSDAKRRPDE